MKNITLLAVALILIFAACRRDDDDTIIDPTTPDPTVEVYEPPVKNVSAGVTVFVVDENENPVSDAKVILNGQNYTTDTYGHLILKNLSINTLGTLVKIDQPGYFPGSRRFFPVDGENSRVKVKLLPKIFDQSFNAADGGLINFAAGASVDFSPNSIQTENGEIYEGVVKIASQWIDPTTLAGLEQMPGNLQGVNTDLEEVALISYGMVAIEIEGTGGEALNIAEGSSAKITMPIPASILNSAPAQIPLWSYNETYGLWEEEGIGTLEGEHYVGIVSHFSTWNCDVPITPLNLRVELVDPNGMPLNDYFVKICRGSTPVSGSNYTNEAGIFSSVIPSGLELTLKVLDPCGGELYTENIGSFTTSTDLGSLVIFNTTVNNTTITGSLVDCNDDPVTNGLVTATYYDQSIYAYVDNSNFSINLNSCPNVSEIEIVAINLDDFTQSDPIIALAKAETDLGVIKPCENQLDNFLSLTVDGKTEIMQDVTFTPYSVAYPHTLIVAKDSVTMSFVDFTFAGETVGDYSDPANYFIYAIISPSMNVSFYDGFDLDNFLITEYGTRVVGSFNGTVVTLTDTLSLSCSFEVSL